MNLGWCSNLDCRFNVWHKTADFSIHRSAFDKEISLLTELKMGEGFFELFEL